MAVTAKVLNAQKILQAPCNITADRWE